MFIHPMLHYVPIDYLYLLTETLTPLVDFITTQLTISLGSRFSNAIAAT